MGAGQSSSDDTPASLLAALAEPEGSMRMSALQRSISHEGDLGRLDCLLEHLRSGGNTSLTLIGAPRRTRAEVLHTRVQRWLHRRFPAAAISTVSVPLSGHDGLCAGWHLPRGQPRLVFIDTSAVRAARAARTAFSNASSAADANRAVAQQLEALLRSQLGRPMHAVVLVHGARGGSNMRAGAGGVAPALAEERWAPDGPEGQVSALARYYALPALSLRDALWDPRANASALRASPDRAPAPRQLDPQRLDRAPGG